MSKFGYLAKCTVSEESRAKYQIHQIPGRPVLELAPLTQQNKPYIVEALRRPMRPAPKSASGEELIQHKKLERVYEAEMLVKHSIRGWDGVVDVAGNPVPFAAGDAREFLMELAEKADWIFDDVVRFVLNPANFATETIDVEDVSKNSVGGSPGR